jgi:hypothetical protein
MKLPKPVPVAIVFATGEEILGYTVEQMMAWGKACAEACAEREREACAVICEGMRHPWGHSAETQDWVGATEHCAAAIRARGNT